MDDFNLDALDNLDIDVATEKAQKAAAEKEAAEKAEIEKMREGADQCEGGSCVI